MTAIVLLIILVVVSLAASLLVGHLITVAARPARWFCLDCRFGMNAEWQVVRHEMLEHRGRMVCVLRDLNDELRHRPDRPRGEVR